MHQQERSQDQYGRGAMHGSIGKRTLYNLLALHRYVVRKVTVSMRERVITAFTTGTKTMMMMMVVMMTDRDNQNDGEGGGGNRPGFGTGTGTGTGNTNQGDSQLGPFHFRLPETQTPIQRLIERHEQAAQAEPLTDVMQRYADTLGQLIARNNLAATAGSFVGAVPGGASNSEGIVGSYGAAAHALGSYLSAQSTDLLGDLQGDRLRGMLEGWEGTGGVGADDDGGGGGVNDDADPVPTQDRGVSPEFWGTYADHTDSSAVRGDAVYGGHSDLESDWEVDHGEGHGRDAGNDHDRVRQGLYRNQFDTNEQEVRPAAGITTGSRVGPDHASEATNVATSWHTTHLAQESIFPLERLLQNEGIDRQQRQRYLERGSGAGSGSVTSVRAHDHHSRNVVLDDPLSISQALHELLNSRPSAADSDSDWEMTIRSGVEESGSRALEQQQNLNHGLSSVEVRWNQPRQNHTHDQYTPLPFDLTESLCLTPFSLKQTHIGHEIISVEASEGRGTPATASDNGGPRDYGSSGGANSSHHGKRKGSPESRLERKMQYDLSSAFLHSIRDCTRMESRSSANRVARLATERFALACTLSLRPLGVEPHVQSDFTESQRNLYGRAWMLLLEEYLRVKVDADPSIAQGSNANTLASRRLPVDPTSPGTQEQFDSIRGLNYTITTKLRPVHGRTLADIVGKTLFVTLRIHEGKTMTEVSIVSDVETSFRTEIEGTPGEDDNDWQMYDVERQYVL